MYKRVKRSLAFLFFCLVAGVAWAGHTSVGVVVGPMWGPWYSPPAYYYPPYYQPYYPSYQPVIIQRAPQMYIEQYAPAPDAAPAPNAGNYWYYCAASKAYYPYVNECPGGWQKVAPQPPTPQ